MTTSSDFAGIDIDGLRPGPVLNLMVAEQVLGWRIDYDSYRHWLHDVTVPDQLPNGLDITAPGDVFHGARTSVDVPPSSTDIAAAYAMEATLPHQGLQHAYVEALVRAVGEATIFASAIECEPHSDEGDGWGVAWNLAHASPDQRCRAALTAKLQHQKGHL